MCGLQQTIAGIGERRALWERKARRDTAQMQPGCGRHVLSSQTTQLLLLWLLHCGQVGG